MSIIFSQRSAIAEEFQQNDVSYIDLQSRFSVGSVISARSAVVPLGISALFIVIYSSWRVFSLIKSFVFKREIKRNVPDVKGLIINGRRTDVIIQVRQ